MGKNSWNNRVRLYRIEEERKENLRIEEERKETIQPSNTKDLEVIIDQEEAESIKAKSYLLPNEQGEKKEILVIGEISTQEEEIEGLRIQYKSKFWKNPSSQMKIDTLRNKLAIS